MKSKSIVTISITFKSLRDWKWLQKVILLSCCLPFTWSKPFCVNSSNNPLNLNGYDKWQFLSSLKPNECVHITCFMKGFNFSLKVIPHNKFGSTRHLSLRTYNFKSTSNNANINPRRKVNRSIRKIINLTFNKEVKWMRASW